MLRRLRACAVRLAASLDRTTRDRALTEELEAHLRMHVDDNLRNGMTPAAARRDALIRLGGVPQTLERCRDVASIPWMVRLVDRLRPPCS